MYAQMLLLLYCFRSKGSVKNDIFLVFQFCYSTPFPCPLNYAVKVERLCAHENHSNISPFMLPPSKLSLGDDVIYG